MYNSTNTYFTDDCIIDFGLFFLKIYYEDIAIIDINKYGNKNASSSQIWITIITKKIKKIKIAKNLFNTTKDHIDILKEIESRVPNVLIGYTKENIEKVKQKTV